MRGLGKALLLLVTVAGCGEILRADDYVVEKGGPAGLDQESLFYDDECRACLAEACGDALSACDADPACRELRTCIFGCRDPGCYRRCMQPGGYNFSNNWPLGDVDTCTAGPCERACRAYEGNFDCVGNYRFPRLMPRVTSSTSRSWWAWWARPTARATKGGR